MKIEDYILMEQSLQNAWDSLEEAYEFCDTSLRDREYENDSDINDWNKRFLEVMEEIQNLRAEMVFTFKFEEPEE